MERIRKIKEILMFIIPSGIGIILFLLPLNYGGKINIGVGYLADLFKMYVGELLPFTMTIVIVLSAIGALMMRVYTPKWVMKHEVLKEIFCIEPLWVTCRLVGAVFAVCTLFGVGPQFIYSGETGGTLLYNLIPTLATWFLLSGFFLPILLNFGVMDFFGTLIQSVMRPLFKVPGRSAIDAIASWIGSGPVGVVLTNNQLKEGYYTEKEAGIIAVCFSLVSLPFATILAEFLQLSHVFLPFYLTVTIASLVAALILPRIYPLCQLKDTYIAPKQICEQAPEGTPLATHAFNIAVKRANSGHTLGGIVKSGLSIVVDVYFSLIPIVMCFGTLSLIVTEYTQILTILAYPVTFILKILQIPAAAEAAPAVVVGFADMFLPAVLVANVDFEITRFVVGVLSFTQLIYMTETGIIILKSDIPLGLKELVIIFIERTVITLPIIALIAHIIF